MERNRKHVGGNEISGKLKVSAALRVLASTCAFAVGVLGLAILLPATALAQQQMPVRVVSAGKVVRTEASLPELKRFAEEESAMLEGYASSAPLMRR